MLTFPQVLDVDGVVCFPDDEDCNLYYLVPGRPKLRIDDNGKPVFRALFWTDQADGSGGSVAGIRGALLHFDVNLTVSEETEEEIRRQIESAGIQQQRRAIAEREERERLERMAKAQGQDIGGITPNVPEVGPVRFGSVLYTGGNVVLLEEKSGGFVEWSSAGGPPSLIADNNSAFAMRLGAEGAAVWLRGLEQDATAIGVRYELKFQARLPSLQIRIWAGSHEELELTRKVDRVWKNQDQGCSDADVERIDVNEVTSTLTEESLVNVEIIKGSAKISDDHVAQLRDAAMSLISDRVKEVVQHKIRGLTEEERKSSMIKHISEEVTAFAELRLNQRDVVEWGVNPQATITDFLQGHTGAQSKDLMTVVDLSNPVVATLSVPVSVDASWDADPQITRVTVEVTYPSAVHEEDKTQSVSFDKETQETTLHWRRGKGNKAGEVEFTAKAFVKGAAEPITIPAGKTGGPVHVQVPNLGKFSVRARPNPTDFALKGSGKVTGVELSYSYRTPAEPDHVEGQVVLRPDQLDGRLITHTTYREIAPPLRVRTRYLRESAPAIEGPEQFVWMRAGEEAQLDVPPAWPDKLQVTARVRPGVPTLRQVGVDLMHTEEDGFTSQETMLLDADGEWVASTSLVQADKTKQRFSYRYRVMSESQTAVSPWLEAEGDQELPLLPVLPVRVRVDRLKLGTDFTDAIVRLTYAFDDAGESTVYQEFYVSDPAAELVWLVPRGTQSRDSFSYDVTLYRPNGEEVPVKGTGRGETLIVPRPA